MPAEALAERNSTIVEPSAKKARQLVRVLGLPREQAETGLWPVEAAALGPLCQPHRSMSLSSLSQESTKKHPPPKLRSELPH